MTTRATEAKKKKKRGDSGYQYLTQADKEAMITASQAGATIDVAPSGAVFALGDNLPGGDSGYTIGGTALAGERAGSKFGLASDKGGEGDDLEKKIRDVWEKHKTAILFGAGALIVIAIARKR